MSTKSRTSILSLVFLSLLTFQLTGVFVDENTSSVQTAAAYMTADVVPQEKIDPSMLNISRRLQQRLLKRNMPVYPLGMLQDALEIRRFLLPKKVSVAFVADDGRDFGTFDASIASHPDWLRADFTSYSFSFGINEVAIEKEVQVSIGSSLPVPVDGAMTAIVQEGEILRGVFDHPAEPGYVFPPDMVRDIRASLEGAVSTVTIKPQLTPGVIHNQTGQEFGSLTLLSRGQSNFAGSGDGRISNVEKGLSEFINGVIVPPGGVFSFNEAVHNMNLSAGWKDALTIINGTELVPMPGGGICQVATTTYRAALRAGLPIEDRANHSLYVTYYEKYGVGIDATIFPGSQDLTFRNDTGNYILLQAYSHGFEASVNVYGSSDGRSAALEGPYFMGAESAEVSSLLSHPLRSNEIAWLRHVTFKDGSQQSDLILSQYKSIPEYLRQRYAKEREKTDAGNT